MSSTENPFERYDIDPSAGPAGITERFRELIDDVVSEEERNVLRKAWEQLTSHPERRVQLALLAHPKGPSLPAPQPAPDSKESNITLASLLGLPSLRESLALSELLTEQEACTDTLIDDPALVCPSPSEPKP